MYNFIQIFTIYKIYKITIALLITSYFSFNLLIGSLLDYFKIIEKAEKLTILGFTIIAIIVLSIVIRNIYKKLEDEKNNHIQDIKKQNEDSIKLLKEVINFMKKKQ